MPVGKSSLPRWVYDCDCKNCKRLEFVNDPAHSRNGMYCIPGIEALDAGKEWNGLHADDDRHIRCDFYIPKEGNC